MFNIPTFEELNLAALLPAIALATWATILLLVDLFITRKEITAWLTLGGLGFAFVANLFLLNGSGDALMGMFRADSFTAVLNVIILVSAIIGVLMSVEYLRRTDTERGEFYSLFLFSVVGVMFMAGANDIIVVFVALELLSIPLYVLAALRSPDLKSEEAGLKYFILGAFASAFFVYGAALVYGATGTTSLPEIATTMQFLFTPEGPSVILLLLGVGLMLVGLGFKAGIVPFHMWTPDVYEGAPTPVTAFMSVGAKVGAFAALIRILFVGLPMHVLLINDTFVAAWQTITWLLAAATLILGNLVAISQTNIKRMLAYSSIAHAGYIMMALAAGGTPGLEDTAVRAALVYLLAYAFTNLGAFAIAIAIEKDDGTGTTLDDFKGLWKTHPLLVVMMSVFMLSLTGIPLTSGFIGKWFVFQVTVEANLIPLAIIGVLTSVVSAFYYIRVVVNMFLTDDAEGSEAPGALPYLRFAVYLAFAGTVIVGILPFLITALTDRAAVIAAIVP